MMIQILFNSYRCRAFYAGMNPNSGAAQKIEEFLEMQE
jgi:hypothetical protein